MNLNQITIPSLDVKQSEQFYSKLGLKLIVRALPKYVRFECPNGDTTFSVHLVETLPIGLGPIIYFESKDLDKMVQNLEEKGIIFEEQPNDKPWLWREARLKDPDGNQLIIYHAGKNRKSPPWRL